MKRLVELTPAVKYMLERYPELRDDDDRLISGIYYTFYGLDNKQSFYSVMKNRKQLGLPSWESITRIRRKLQEEHPELQSSKAKAEIKQTAIGDYIAYSRSEV